MWNAVLCFVDNLDIAEKMTKDKMTLDKMTLDQITLDKMTTQTELTK
jgi:hypothetical protein